MTKHSLLESTREWRGLNIKVGSLLQEPPSPFREHVGLAEVPGETRFLGRGILCASM